MRCMSTNVRAFVTKQCAIFLGKDHREKKYKAHRQFGDRRGGVTSARTYFYADESKCDQHMETFLKCIRASGWYLLWIENHTPGLNSL